MRIYEFAFNEMIEESSWASMSLHTTKYGAVSAMNKHRNKYKSDWKKDYPNKSDEPYPFGRFQDWHVREREIETP